MIEENMTQTRFCTACGKKNEDEANRFCIYCGAEFEEIVSDSETMLGIEFTEKSGVEKWEEKDNEIYVDTPGSATEILNNEFCTNCGAPIHQENIFCVQCGVRYGSENSSFTEFVSSYPIVHEKDTQNEFADEPKKPKKRSKSAMMILIFVLIGIVGAGILVWIFVSPESIPIIGQFFEQKEEEDEKTNFSEDTSEDESDEKKERDVTEKTEVMTTVIDMGAITSSTGDSPELPDLVEGMIDGDNNTAWASDLNEDGTWGTATIPYGSDITIYGIYLKNGCWESQYDLVQNSRAKELLIEFDDGSVEAIIASDSMLSNFAEMINSEGELLLFAEEHTTSKLKITINDVYPGANNAVYITDISVVLTPDAASPTTPAGSIPQTRLDEIEELILAGAQRYYTNAEISGLSEDEFRLVRNGLYALSGRIFKSPDLRDYFTAKDWYSPLYSTDEETKQRFNQYQDSNLELVVKLEKEKGYRD